MSHRFSFVWRSPGEAAAAEGGLQVPSTPRTPSTIGSTRDFFYPPLTPPLPKPKAVCTGTARLAPPPPPPPTHPYQPYHIGSGVYEREVISNAPPITIRHPPLETGVHLPARIMRGVRVGEDANTDGRKQEKVSLSLPPGVHTIPPVTTTKGRLLHPDHDTTQPPNRRPQHRRRSSPVASPSPDSPLFTPFQHLSDLLPMRQLAYLSFLIPFTPFLAVIYILTGQAIFQSVGSPGFSYTRPSALHPIAFPLLHSAQAAALGGFILSFPIMLFLYLTVVPSRAERRQPDDFFEDDGLSEISRRTYEAWIAALVMLSAGVGAGAGPLGFVCLKRSLAAAAAAGAGAGGRREYLGPGGAAQAGIVGAVVIVGSVVALGAVWLAYCNLRHTKRMRKMMESGA